MDARIRQPVQNRGSGERYQRIPNGKGGFRHAGRPVMAYYGSVEPACAPIRGRVYQGDYTCSPRKKVHVVYAMYTTYWLFNPRNRPPLICILFPANTEVHTAGTPTNTFAELHNPVYIQHSSFRASKSVNSPLSFNWVELTTVIVLYKAISPPKIRYVIILFISVYMISLGLMGFGIHTREYQDYMRYGKKLPTTGYLPVPISIPSSRTRSSLRFSPRHLPPQS
jgi:hypothetical protein